MKIPKLLNDIEIEVSKISGITINNIRSPKKDREFSDARAVVWTLAREFLGYSYPFLAKIYCRDHTTIISGVRKIKNSPSYNKVEKIALKLKLPQMKMGWTGRSLESWEI